MPVRIFEPHPSARQDAYMHSGRGGAGNHFKAPPTTSPTTAHGPASLFTGGLPPSAHPKFTTGRGGAGNMHPSTEKVVYDFDEELRRQTSNTSTVHRVGRGGAGNWMSEKIEGIRRKTSMSSAGSR